jgi:hypothetical protein
MKRTIAVAPAEPTAVPAETRVDLDGLRRRLPAATEKEVVVLDFLEDDLREAREALASVTSYVGDVEVTLADPHAGRDHVLALALGRGPLEQIEYLAGVLGNVRRRLVQVTKRL